MSEKTGWLSLKIHANRHEAEKLGHALMEWGGLSVSFEDQDVGRPEEKSIYRVFSQSEPDLWERCVVTSLFPGDTKADALLKRIRSAMRWNHKPVFSAERLPDRDWVKETQQQWTPIRVGKRLWIVPSWHEGADFGKKALILRLDPGLAFGTGAHPTTRLCLEALERCVKKKDGVLDYGCGSGILAIGALKMGASRAVGVDTDPQALQASERNALENRVSLGLHAHGKLPPFKAEVLVANILLNPLIGLKSVFLRHTKPKSRILLSGILSGQTGALISAYAPEFDFEAPRILEDWACLSGVRKGPSKKQS